jgi:hypothetical protein
LNFIHEFLEADIFPTSVGFELAVAAALIGLLLLYEYLNQIRSKAFGVGRILLYLLVALLGLFFALLVVRRIYLIVA